MKDQVAVAVSKGNFQRRLGEKPRAPTGVFLRSRRPRRIKRRHLRHRMRGRAFVARLKLAAPIQRLQFPTLVHAKTVGSAPPSQPKHLPNSCRPRVGSRGRPPEDRGSQNNRRAKTKYYFHSIHVHGAVIVTPPACYRAEKLSVSIFIQVSRD